MCAGEWRVLTTKLPRRYTTSKRRPSEQAGVTSLENRTKTHDGAGSGRARASSRRLSCRLLDEWRPPRGRGRRGLPAAYPSRKLFARWALGAVLMHSTASSGSPPGPTRPGDAPSSCATTTLASIWHSRLPCRCRWPAKLPTSKSRPRGSRHHWRWPPSAADRSRRPSDGRW